MFIGHFSLAFASKRVAPKPSLGWAIAACQFPDLLWPIFSIAGMEHFHIEKGNTAFTPLAFDYYPWSHSLIMDCVWGVVLGLLYLWRSADRRGAFVLGVLVVSHWILDWITHRPDMALMANNQTLVGLGLWNSVPATIIVETIMFAASVWLYSRSTSPTDRIGRIGWWGFVGFLALIYVGNVVGPLPPSNAAVSVAALLLWALLPLASWIDRHRIANRALGQESDGHRRPS